MQSVATLCALFGNFFKNNTQGDEEDVDSVITLKAKETAEAKLREECILAFPVVKVCYSRSVATLRAFY